MEDIVDRLLHETVMAIYPDGSKLTNGPSDIAREAAEEIKRLRGALEWYAGNAAWTVGPFESADGDYGTKARAALNPGK